LLELYFRLIVRKSPDREKYDGIRQSITQHTPSETNDAAGPADFEEELKHFGVDNFEFDESYSSYQSSEEISTWLKWMSKKFVKTFYL
jgi:hypothetical protein